MSQALLGIRNQRTALYYPYFSIPTNYLKQVLLYWDTISSIIPDMAEENNPNIYTPEMAYLESLSIFYPIRPEKFLLDPLNSQHRENIRAEFLSLLDSIHLQASPIKNATQIHMGKLYAAFTKDLEEHQLLLSTALSTDGFCQIDRHAGYVYMSILAKYLAESQFDLMVPVTNIKESHNFAFLQKRKLPQTVCFDFLLKDILPLPTDETSIDDILQFKTRRYDELLRFRLLLDDFNKKIGSCESLDEIHQMTASFKDDLVIGVSDIHRTLKESRISCIAGSIRTLITMAPSMFSAGCNASTLIEKNTFVKEALMLGSSFLGILYLGVELANYVNSKSAFKNISPYSYLLHAHRDFL